MRPYACPRGAALRSSFPPSRSRTTILSNDERPPVLSTVSLIGRRCDAKLIAAPLARSRPRAGYSARPRKPTRRRPRRRSLPTRSSISIRGRTGPVPIPTSTPPSARRSRDSLIELLGGTDSLAARFALGPAPAWRLGSSPQAIRLVCVFEAAERLSNVHREGTSVKPPSRDRRADWRASCMSGQIRCKRPLLVGVSKTVSGLFGPTRIQIPPPLRSPGLASLPHDPHCGRGAVVRRVDVGDDLLRQHAGPARNVLEVCREDLGDGGRRDRLARLQDPVLAERPVGADAPAALVGDPGECPGQG